MNNVHIKNLWKVATAYLVGSFALIQFANIAFPYFEVEQYLGLSSDKIMKALFIGLPVGLPLVLTGFYFLRRSGIIEENTSIEPKLQINSGSYKQKIAVIPFTNLNKDEDGAFLVDGIVENHQELNVLQLLFLMRSNHYHLIHLLC